MTFRLRAFVLPAVMLVACFSGYSFADNVTFTLGNHHQQGEENVLFLSDQGPAMMIMGFTNFSNTEVDFSSTEFILGAGGQAKVTAQDGLLNDVTISLPGHTFTSIIFNPFHPVNDNDLFVTVTEMDGDMDHFQYGQTNGSNFLTIVDEDGTGIQSVTIDSPGGFDDLRQVRLAGISGVQGPAPEPSSLLLLGTGVAGMLGFIRRRM